MSDTPPPSVASYDEGTGTWTLRYDGEWDYVNVPQGDLPDGDFTLVCTAVTLPSDPEAGVGLFVVGPDGPVYLLASAGGDGKVPVHLKLVYADGEAHCYRSDTGFDWEHVAGGPLERPTTAGLVLRYGPSLTPVAALVAQYRLLDGLLSDDAQFVGVAPMSAPAPPVPTFSSYVEPIIHCIIGAQFGDQEWDVGKSVRWNMFFADRHFILDVNSGDTRYYVVNWSETFPQAKHGVTGINYFKRPVDFRKEQFRQADLAWYFGDEDWVLWVDAHEGFSVDNTSIPDDWAMEPFQSYVFREVQRAVDADQDWSCLPLYAFVGNDDPVNVEYPIGDGNPIDDEGTILAASQPIAVPLYIANQGLVRLIKVSALREPTFDWDLLDVPSTPDTGCKAQIISYAYAHWNLQDIVPPATEVEPLTEANDDGWRMRLKISEVRPVAGLPVDDEWIDPALDDDGLPGPVADGTTYNPVDSDRVPPAPDPAMAGITSPLYDSTFRINLRDGIWYEGTDGSGALGNLPLTWDETEGKWIPGYPPEVWHPSEFEQVAQ